MILQALYDLYGRLIEQPEYGIAPPGYSTQKIGFKIVLRPDGTLVDIQDARIEHDGKLQPLVLHVPGDSKPSGSGINPCFLWDNAAYLLGFAREGEPAKVRDRALECFEASRSEHSSKKALLDCRAYDAVCAFLESWDPGGAAAFPLLEDNRGFGVFQLIGEPSFVHEDSKIRDWWSEQQQGSDDLSETACLVTGGNAEIARIHKPSIKGVAGAQSSGALLVSFNDDAYESYGNEQSHNAPVSVDAARGYAQALNSLTSGPQRSKHLMRLSHSTIVFWTGAPSVTEDVFAAVLSGGPRVSAQDEAVRERVQAFMQAVRSGRPSHEPPDKAKTEFFILGLSPNASRLAVNLFERSSIEALVQRLHEHHEALRVEPRRDGAEFPPLWELLRETVREGDDPPPLLEGALLRAIMSGGPYPCAWMQAVINRIRIDRRVTQLRCACLRAYWVRNFRKEFPVSLAKDNPTPAYRLGRLFAALEKTQSDALGGELNATIRDRYYASASTTPRVVFPRLFKVHQHHLAKLEGGRKVNREKLVQEIVSPLETFPSHLNLEDQSLFALGYYHQREDFFTRHDTPTREEDTQENNDE